MHKQHIFSVKHALSDLYGWRDEDSVYLFGVMADGRPLIVNLTFVNRELLNVAIAWPDIFNVII